MGTIAGTSHEDDDETRFVWQLKDWRVAPYDLFKMPAKESVLKATISSLATAALQISLAHGEHGIQMVPDLLNVDREQADTYSAR